MAIRAPATIDTGIEITSVKAMTAIGESGSLGSSAAWMVGIGRDLLGRSGEVSSLAAASVACEAWLALASALAESSPPSFSNPSSTRSSSGLEGSGPLSHAERALAVAPSGA